MIKNLKSDQLVRMIVSFFSSNIQLEVRVAEGKRGFNIAKFQTEKGYGTKGVCGRVIIVVVV